MVPPKIICEDKIPRTVHFWDLEGFVKLSNEARNKFKKLIRKYGIRKLARYLKFDRETIYSIYSNGRKKGAHSIKHLLKIADFLNYDLETLEGEVTHYGGKQTHMYEISFPFLPTPLHLRAVTIHGDGSFYYNSKQNSMNAEWYQLGGRIDYMENLLDKIISNNPIKSKTKSIEDDVCSISIPNHLVRLVCISLNIELDCFHSTEFFRKVSKLSPEYAIQVFFQFIVDEAYLKGTTLTISQKKKWSRDGLKILLDGLSFDHSNPVNDKQDITIYNYNFPKILNYLEEAKNIFGNIAGLWFKEREFIEACKKSDPSRYPLIRKSMRVNKEIFNKLKIAKSIFSYQDVREFGRTSREVNKAIRCWKKNKLIERISWNRYKILEEDVKQVTA
jgi:hypothetical protein